MENVYGCLMLNMRKKIKNWNECTSIIDKKDIYDDESNDYGVENEPHVTVLYGFLPSVKVNDIKKHLNFLSENIKFTITGIGIFPGKGDTPYDVVKFNIKSDDLTKLNKICKKIPNEETFPEYNPHMTIAYVKKGCGSKYIKKYKTPQNMESGNFIYSFDGDKKTFSINKK